AALRLLHPLMPFLTEELSQALPTEWRRGADASRADTRLVQASYPRAEEFPRDSAAEADVERLIDVVRTLRNLRAEMSVPPSKPIDVRIAAEDPAVRASLEGIADAIRVLAK